MNTPNTTKSEGEYVSLIQSLTSRKKVLADSIDHWNTANVWFVGFTVLAAVRLFVTQRTVISRGKQLEQVQEELSAAKEQLANLNLAAVSGVAEDLRNKNLELIKSITPRELAVISKNGKENIDSLKPFAGTQVIIECIRDNEAQRAAASLEYIIESARWTTISFVVVDPDVIQEYGVIVQHLFQHERSERAASALVDFLESSDWVASKDFVNPERHGDVLAPNTLRIRIGFKPSPFFRPQMVEGYGHRNETKNEADGKTNG